jgi:hypothetical protein
MPIWAILKMTMDEFFDIIKHFGEYGLEKMNFELGGYRVTFYIIPGSDTALVVISNPKADIENECTKALKKIINILSS